MGFKILLIIRSNFSIELNAIITGVKIIQIYTINIMSETQDIYCK